MGPRPEEGAKKRRPWLAAAAAFLLVVVAIGLPALLRGSSRTPASQIAAPADTAPATVVLPTLPSDQALYPELFDENGCLKTGPAPTDVDCGNQVPYNEGLDGPPETNPTRHLMGFLGEYYSTELTAQRVVVLTDTVTPGLSKTWEAFGLVRNETPLTVGKVTVRASLVNELGGLLAVVEAAVPINDLRPGEPGPFTLSPR